MPVRVNQNHNVRAKAYEVRAGREIREILSQLGTDLRRYHRSIAPEDRGGYKRKLRKQVKGRGIHSILEMFDEAPHEFWVNEGRRKKKKRPPIKAILGWVRRRGTFGSTPRELLSAAFAVANSIAKKGIKPKKLFDRTLKDNARLVARAQAMIGRRIAKVLNG